MCVYYWVRVPPNIILNNVISFFFLIVTNFEKSTEVKGPFGYSWKLKTKKHCSKIIFKYVNSTAGLIFNKKVAKKWGLWVSWLKSCWKSYCVCIVHIPKSTIMAWKKKKKRKTWMWEEQNALPKCTLNYIFFLIFYMLLKF